MAWYGGWDGPTSNTRFRACMDMRTSTQNETQGYVQIRRWVEATGSFAGTILDTSWADKVTLYNGGTYADSGWVNVGWVGYGTATTQSASASYTSGSGAYRSSSVSGSYAPAVPTWRPNACTNCVNVRNSDNKNTVSWTRNATTPRPYAGIYVDRQIDGGAWSRAATLGGGSSSWADSSTSANHAYRYRVLPYNSAYDASAYAYSETTYNTPAAPSKVTVARKAETTVTVTLDNPALTATALAAAAVGRWLAVGHRANRGGRTGRDVGGFAGVGARGTTVPATHAATLHRLGRPRARPWSPSVLPQSLRFWSRLRESSSRKPKKP